MAGVPKAAAIRTVIIAGRIGLGAAMMVSPTRATRLYLGDDAARPGLRYYVRIAGGREIALAVAQRTAGRQRALRRRAFLLGSLFDLWDGVDAMLTRGLSPTARLIAATTSLTWALLGVAAAQLDPDADAAIRSFTNGRGHRGCGG
ncbi:MAG TPA: hypothetical protein VFQ37_07545 [Mycobacterium sp.]|nr:hypothetical protein [Mycobacterium sp.]